jgi:ribulose 1,5-bisphosphate synthetase/thiazole synthase
MIVFLLLLGLTRTIFIGNIQEVIIIGAGISGLRASQLLTQNSIPHLLL